MAVTLVLLSAWNIIGASSIGRIVAGVVVCVVMFIVNAMAIVIYKLNLCLNVQSE